MQSDRKTALKFILAHEGGKVDHPKDPGGRTNRGITQRTYDAWLATQGRGSKDVFGITEAEVHAIYNAQYLDRVQYDHLPAGLNYAVADFAVNSGVSRATKYLQRVLGVKQDGVIGEMTLAAVREQCETPEATFILIDRLCADRMAFLRSLKTWKTFGKGWTRRVMGENMGAQINDHGVIDYAKAMVVARGALRLAAPAPIGTYDDEYAGKGLAEDIKATATVEGVGTIGAGATGIAIILKQMAEDLAPLVGVPGLGDAITVITAGLGFVSAGLLLYSAISNLRSKRANG